MLSTLASLDGGLTLLAPIVAIVLALATKRILPSLAVAALAGAFIAADLDPIGAVSLLLGTVQGVVWDKDHAIISGFSLTVAAMVGLLGRAGATRALVRQVERVAKGRRGAQRGPPAPRPSSQPRGSPPRGLVGLVGCLCRTGSVMGPYRAFLPLSAPRGSRG